MRRRLTFLALWAAGVLCIQAPVWSILIETTDRTPNQRVGGFWVREDAKQIVITIKTPDGKDKVETFERSKIKVLHKVDRERLAKLNKDQPKAYRDYAAELAEKKGDPEATELAMRLFVIAAYLDTPGLGRSSLVSMSNLATNSADARKFRALAFLLDPKSDASLLNVEAIKTVAPTMPESKANTKALTDFQKALKLYRNAQVSQIKDAKNMVNDKSIAEIFARAGLDHKRFVQACNDAPCTKCKLGTQSCSTCNGKGQVMDQLNMGFQMCMNCNGKGKLKCASCDGYGLNPYPEDLLRAVLKAEIWAVDQLVPADLVAKKGNEGGGSWSRALTLQQTPLPVLMLENITEFDPRKNKFVDGKWIAP